MTTQERFEAWHKSQKQFSCYVGKGQYAKLAWGACQSLNDKERESLLAERNDALARIKVLEDVLSQTKSVCNSVNKSSRHEIKMSDGRYFAQTEEWVNWVHSEILPMIEACLSTTPTLGQEIDKFDDEQFKKNGGMPYGTYGGY